MYEGMDKEIGRLIKEERRRRGWTQGQLRYKAGIAGSGTICNIERGFSRASPETLLKICDAFGLTVDELLGLGSPSRETAKQVIQRDGHLARCPICRKMVGHGSSAQLTDNYCPRCGQRLKWG